MCRSAVVKNRSCLCYCVPTKKLNRIVKTCVHGQAQCISAFSLTGGSGQKGTRTTTPELLTRCDFVMETSTVRHHDRQMRREGAIKRNWFKEVCNITLRHRDCLIRVRWQCRHVCMFAEPGAGQRCLRLGRKMPCCESIGMRCHTEGAAWVFRPQLCLLAYSHVLCLVNSAQTVGSAFVPCCAPNPVRGCTAV